MPQRKKKVRSKVRSRVKPTVPAWAKSIPPAQLAELHKQFLLSGAGQSGGSFWSWVKGAAKSVGKFVKDNGLISKGLTAVGTVTGQPELVAAGTVAGAIGFGRKKKRQAGRGVVGIVQNPRPPVLLRM